MKKSPINYNRLKKYICGYCGDYYFMTVAQNAKVSKINNKKPCEKEDCKNKHFDKIWEKENQRIRSKSVITKSNSDLSNYLNELQTLCGKISLKIDEGLPCLARGDFPIFYDPGHIIPISTAPSLRCHIWNIHKQGRESNISREDFEMQRGFSLRYKTLKIDFLQKERLKYKVLKPTLQEVKQCILNAKSVLKNDINDRTIAQKLIGLYK